MPNIDDYIPASGRHIDENNKVVNVIESLTGSYKTTESDHTLNHLGKGYKASLDIVTLASGQSLSWCLKGPSTLFSHIKYFTLDAMGSSVKLEILRGADVTVNTGTIVPLNNTNDNSEETAQSTIRANPTYTGGTAWTDEVVIIDSIARSSGMISTSNNVYEELVTKSGDTNYIIKITNIGIGTVSRARFGMFLYEEELGIG